MKDMFNRELSWLQFNSRVLQEAQDKSVPVMQRLRFLGIYSNNQDEFIKVRVANLIRYTEMKSSKEIKKMTGDYAPAELLLQINKHVEELQQVYRQTYKDIIAELERENIYVVNEKQITEAGDIAGLMGANKSYLYVDVGGGSTEVTIYNDNKRIGSESFPLGTVRMISDAVDKDELKRFKKWIAEIAAKYKPRKIIGSGGNINRVHKLLQKRDKEAINYLELKNLYDTLKGLTFEERMKNYNLNIYRADVIMPAMKIFLTVGKYAKIDEIIAPKIGLSDGIIHKLYTENFSNL